MPQLSTSAAEPDLSRGRKHAANVLLPLFDWYRAQEAAAFDSEARSASDVIRKALARYLDEQEYGQEIYTLAVAALERDEDLDARRAAALAARMK